MKSLKIGLIGFGRFGQILTKHLLKHLPQTQVLVSSTQKDLKLPTGAKSVSLKAASQCPIIIPCVPISTFESVIKKITPLLKPNSLVIDVCTVKTHPVKVMKKHLPKNINILATHPMWGPESAEYSLKGLTTVLCPVRLPKSQLTIIKKGLEKLGQKIVIMLPQKHDQLLAKSQAIAHLFGLINTKLDLKPTKIDTLAVKHLLTSHYLVKKDTWQLFNDMFKFNPYSQKMLKKLKSTLLSIEKDLKL